MGKYTELARAFRVLSHSRTFFRCFQMTLNVWNLWDSERIIFLRVVQFVWCSEERVRAGLSQPLRFFPPGHSWRVTFAVLPWQPVITTTCRSTGEHRKDGLVAAPWRLLCIIRDSVGKQVR